MMKSELSKALVNNIHERKATTTTTKTRTTVILKHNPLGIGMHTFDSVITDISAT